MNTLNMLISTFLPNFIVNKSALSMDGGVNRNVSPNRIMMDTYTNTTDLSTYMADDNQYIMINSSVQYP